MTRRLWVTAVALALGTTLVLGYRLGRARAAGTPQTGALNYTGTLLAFGQPDSTPHDITINLWSGGAIACTTTPPTQTELTNGRFSITLDDSCATVVHQSSDVQAEVVVDGASMGKSAMGAVPYALEAHTASNAAPGSAIATSLVPPGTVIAYAADASGTNGAAPAGWLLCNGQAVSRTAYSELFGLIGTRYGTGNGSTTFNVPDYRGYFLRGQDDGAHRDPDAAARGAIVPGGRTGDVVGSVEGSTLGSHSHGVNDPGHNHGFYGGKPIGQDGSNPSNNTGFNSGGLYYPMGYIGGITASGTGVSIQASGSAETRPVNASVAYLIKS